MGELEWEEWDMLGGALVPKPEIIDRIIPDYSSLYTLNNIQNREDYLKVLKERFNQRKQFILNSDVNQKPDLLKKLMDAFDNLKV